jgi:hypothetical protein
MNNSMKYILPVILLLLFVSSLKGQTPDESKEGEISFMTSQNIYVKFQSTSTILTGDTLFIIQDTKMIPVLIVKDLSSISCVCTPISSRKLSVADKVLTQRKQIQPKKSKDVTAIPVLQPFPASIDTGSVKKGLPAGLKQNISGRIAISSYSNFSNVSALAQRMRYTFSLNARNIEDSKLSAETYISFAHKINNWSEIKNNIYNGLKVYSLSVNYAFNAKNNIWIGRRMNPMLSNAGAIDGIQYETKFKTFTTGIFAGTRPDYMDYSFNARLLQYGGYFGHDYSNKQGGSAQTSVAFVEQKNNGMTDRRFAYMQHSNSLVKNLNFFGSVEFNLYNEVRNINSQDTIYTKNSTPALSNLYISLRYRVIKQLSISLSYSNRQNIIYYETYKSIIDQLLDASTMQGYTLQLNYRPGNKISVGVNAGYRFSTTDPKPSKNLYSYINYSNIPWLNASATLSATIMQTSYINGNIYSLNLSRDIVPGKLYGGVGYRYVDYKFLNAETPLIQHMAEMDLSWSIMKKLSLSVNYEGTFEKGRNYEMIYVNLTQRF